MRRGACHCPPSLIAAAPRLSLQVFVTNGGGGLTEASYGSSMTTKIAAASKIDARTVIGPERMVLSYTPWKTMLAPQLADQRVLLIGDPREKVLEAARNGLTVSCLIA